MIYKISISGKANSGKNTLGKFLLDELIKLENKDLSCKNIAFADPIKEAVLLMFPDLPRKWLFGPSQYRSKIIPDAFKDSQPLTVRQVLLDLGKQGRDYQEDIWIKNFKIQLNQVDQYQEEIVIVEDVRFRNEFDYLKKYRFYQIRLLRDEYSKIDDVSETEQDSIKNNEFDALIYNNGTLEDLRRDVTKIAQDLYQKKYTK